MAFATPADVYDCGLPAAAFKSTPRTIEAAALATGVLTLSNNGLASGALLRFSVEGQGTLGGATNVLPGGLALATMYTASPYQGSSDLFRVTPVGGSLVTVFTSAAVGPFAVVVDTANTITKQLRIMTGVISDALITSASPILPDPVTGLYHEKLILACAHLVARLFAVTLGLSNPNYADSMKAFLDGPIAKMVDGWLDEWRKGVPLIPTPLDQTPDIADNGARAGYDSVAPEWVNGGFI